MKDKILYLILGILIGAIITAGCFLIFGKSNDKSTDFDGRRDFKNMEEFDGEKPNFDNMQDGDAPELPEGMDEFDMKGQRGPGGKSNGERPDRNSNETTEKNNVTEKNTDNKADDNKVSTENS